MALTAGVWHALAIYSLVHGACLLPSVAPTTPFPTPSPTRTPTTRTPTRSPTTKAPTTNPTTASPTTKAPSNNPTTNNPTTNKPTTQNPTTKTPTTKTPTTKTPTTKTPTTKTPTTKTPTTKTPTTNAPTAYGTPIQFAATNPAAPFIADLNHDTKLDVLVANMESVDLANPLGSLSVYMGTGTGSLSPHVLYAGGALPSCAVVAADVNKDGHLDAITVNGHPSFSSTNGFIGVYLGDGAGGFSSMQAYTTGAPMSVHLCTGDFNGDGNVDVATVSLPDQVNVLLGQGDGTFGAPTHFPIANAGTVQSSIGCKDLNGDGKDDLVATSPQSADINVFLANGSPGLFPLPIVYGNNRNGQSAGLAFRDADGDGKIDILSNGAAGAYVYFFQGDGTGNFVAGVGSPTGMNAVSNAALGLAAADFDDDGKLDIYVLLTVANGGVLFMRGDGAGLFTPDGTILTGSFPAANAIATGDMDGDGRADLVLTNRASNTTTIILNPP